MKAFRVCTAEEVEQRDKRLAEYKNRERVANAHRLSAIPDMFRKAALGDLFHVPADSVEQYAAACTSLKTALTLPGIYAVCGEIGDGKTYMACGLINAFCDQGRGARYIKAMDYVKKYRATWKNDSHTAESDFENDHVRVSLLVLDEWQVRNETANENVILFGLIDKRYDAGKTTVLVSNHRTKQDFEQSIDSRIADRICDGGGIIICNWPSLRGRIQRGNAA